MAIKAYKAEIHGDDPKNPVDVYFISADNLVNAAIEASKKLYAKHEEKKLRVTKVEELKGELI